MTGFGKREDPRDRKRRRKQREAQERERTRMEALEATGKVEL